MSTVIVLRLKRFAIRAVSKVVYGNKLRSKDLIDVSDVSSL